MTVVVQITKVKLEWLPKRKLQIRALAGRGVDRISGAAAAAGTLPLKDRTNHVIPLHIH